MKKIIGELLLKMGYGIRNISKDREFHKTQKWSFLKNMNIKTILDIGANEGQFAEEIYDIFPEAKIYSFEPLAETYEKLVDNFKLKNRVYTYNIGLGEEDESKLFYLSSGTASSSLLKMGNLHKNLFPHSSSITEQTVTIKKLDNVIQGIHFQDNLLIKIDVQGAEDKVIRGGLETLSKAKIVVTEVSYTTLYEEQPLFKDIFSLLDKLDFIYFGILEQFNDPKNNVPLFSDAIFVQKEFISELFRENLSSNSVAKGN
jgi:FkbM family methyltransferase